MSPGGCPSQGTVPRLLDTELGLLLTDRFNPKAQASTALTFPSQDGGDKVKAWRDRISKQAEGKAARGFLEVWDPLRATQAPRPQSSDQPFPL